MFPGLGTLINVGAIFIGSSAGVVVGSRLKDRTRELITDVLGLSTLLGAASALIPLWSKRFLTAMPQGWTSLSVIAALITGAIVGSALRIEERIERFGFFLRNRFNARSSTFIEGFLTASLLFAIGPLAILGSISDGMSTGIDQLILKSILDLFASMAFASSLGWGVAAAAIPVAIYQSFWTVLGFFLGNVLIGYQVDAMTITGGVLLIGIGLRLLRIKNIAVGDLLPAIAFAPIFALLLHSFH